MQKLQKFIRGDKIIWLILLFLTLISILEVYSSIGKIAFEKMGGRTTSLILKHSFIILFGYFVIFLISNIKYTVFSPLSKYGLYVCVPLLLATFLFGLSGKAAGRWLELPIIGQFQPSEIAKVVIIIYTARLLTLKQNVIGEISTFRSLLIPVAIVAALIFPENFSTAALIFLVCFLLMFIGGVSFKHWAALASLAVVGLGIFFVVISVSDIDFARSGTWGNRIEEYIAKDKNAYTQVNIAKTAIACGGILGEKPGGTIQGRLLSESHNDFIYAVIIEELGLVGGIVVLLLYLWLFYRCMRIAFKAEGMFAALTSVGLGLLIFIQALVNMGVAVNLLPVTGQTLPFISYGGTSFLFSSIALGIILSISSEVQKKEESEKINEGEELEKDEILAKEKVES